MLLQKAILQAFPQRGGNQVGGVGRYNWFFF